jgi:hypothetical protein
MAMTGHSGASLPINDASPSKHSPTAHCNARRSVCHWPGDVPLPKANDLAGPSFTEARPRRVRARSLRRRSGATRNHNFLKYLLRYIHLLSGTLSHTRFMGEFGRWATWRVRIFASPERFRTGC